MGLTVDYASRERYEVGHWRFTPWDYIVHLAPVSPRSILTIFPHARILFASSGAAISSHYDTINDGSHGLHPEYADNKRKWEAECIASGQDVVIVRPYTFVGAHLQPNKAIMQFIAMAQAGGPVTLLGTGKTVRSYLYGSEMGEWLWTYLFSGQRGPVELGGKTPYTMREISSMVAEAAGVAWEHKQDDSIVDTEYLPLHGIEEKIGLYEAIERTLHETDNQ